MAATIAAVVAVTGGVFAVSAAGAQESADAANEVESTAQPADGETDGASEGGLPGSAADSAATGGTVVVTIFHAADAESKLLADSDAGLPGAARFAAALQSLQADASGPMFSIATGDNLLPSLALAASMRGDDPLADSMALSGLFDAIVLGHHDFDYGPDLAKRYISGFDPPVPFLAANLDISGEPAFAELAEAGLFSPSVMLSRGGVHVGVVGVVAPELIQASSPRGIVAAALGAQVQAEVDRLRAAGAHVVLLAGHLATGQQEQDLLARLRGVDGYVTGGGNQLFANDPDADGCSGDGSEYPVFGADADGKQVPVLAVTGGLRCIGHAKLSVDTASGAVAWLGADAVEVPLDGPADPRIESEVLAPLAVQVKAYAAEVVATAQVDLDGRTLSLNSGASNLGNLVADAVLARARAAAPEFGLGHPQLAWVNAGGIRLGEVLAPGPVTVGHAWRIAPFRDVVVVGEVPRERLVEIFERTLASAPQPAYSFPQVAGLSTFTFDSARQARLVDAQAGCVPSGPPGERVRDLVLADGTAIVADGELVGGPAVVMATLDYLATGGSCTPLADIAMTGIGTTYADALADYATHNLGGVIAQSAYPPVEANDPASARVIDLAPPFTEYVVVQGDTLRRIAAAHLGSAARWPEIFQLSRGLPQPYAGSLHNPDLIVTGWTLRLPL